MAEGAAIGHPFRRIRRPGLFECGSDIDEDGFALALTAEVEDLGGLAAALFLASDRDAPMHDRFDHVEDRVLGIDGCLILEGEPRGEAEIDTSGDDQRFTCGAMGLWPRRSTTAPGLIVPKCHNPVSKSVPVRPQPRRCGAIGLPS
jgi:hypothetical protein